MSVRCGLLLAAILFGCSDGNRSEKCISYQDALFGELDAIDTSLSKEQLLKRGYVGLPSNRPIYERCDSLVCSRYFFCGEELEMIEVFCHGDRHFRDCASIIESKSDSIKMALLLISDSVSMTATSFIHYRLLLKARSVCPFPANAEL